MEFKKCKTYHYANVQKQRNVYTPFLVDALILFFWPLELLQLVPPTPISVTTLVKVLSCSITAVYFKAKIEQKEREGGVKASLIL